MQDEEGFMVLTVKDEYLDKLEEGSYNVVLKLVNGYCKTSIKISGASDKDHEETPKDKLDDIKTGDNENNIWLFIMVFTLGGIFELGIMYSNIIKDVKGYFKNKIIIMKTLCVNYYIGSFLFFLIGNYIIGRGYEQIFERVL